MSNVVRHLVQFGGFGARFLATLGMTTVLAACAAQPTTPTAPEARLGTRTTPTSSTPLQLPAGYTAQLYADGLNAPTAFAFGPGHRLYVAQLNGGENDNTGQIIAIDETSKEKTIVLDGLAKVTGLAWMNDVLYVMSYRSVLKFVAKDGKLGAPQTLVSDVPFNGRSLGHIKVGPSPDPFTSEDEPRLYFTSTGGDPANSGEIFSMRLDGSDQRIIARGLKNAFAFTWGLIDNVMYATEISDALVAPVEEINRIELGRDYGWPHCTGDQTCDGVTSPLATFPPHSTPTGMTWDNGDLIVALWGPTDPHVARVELATGKVSDFARGLKNPMDVTFNWSGHLLLLDFAGQIWEVKKDLPSELQSIPPPQPSPTP